MEIEQQKPQSVQKKPSLTPFKKQLDFPPLQCSDHNSAVIFVNTNATAMASSNTDQPQQKMFLCAKCVQTQFNQLDSSNLMMYEEFVSFLSQNPQQQQQQIQSSNDGMVADNGEAQSQQLLSAQKKNLHDFKQLIEDEKQKVSQTMSKLQDLYQEKCSELVDTLQKEFTQQNQFFIENYGKFENAVQADFEKEAELQKFTEIIHNIQGMPQAKDKENYLAGVYKKKLAWSKASQNIQSLGKRNENFYRELVQNQINNAPKLSNMAQLLSMWITGLDKLIDQVKDNAGVFENLYKGGQQYVPLEIKSVAELTLVTNQMIKNDTLFILNFSGFKAISIEDSTAIAQAIAHLTNICNLQVNLEELGSAVGAQQIADIAASFKHLSHLSFFEFFAFGSKFADAQCAELATGLGEIAPQLKHLKLNLGFNNIGNNGVQSLAESIGKMTNLSSFYLDLKNNNIKAQGAVFLGENLEKVAAAGGFSEIVAIDLSGYSVKRNEIKSTGGIALLRALKKCVNSTQISLDLGHNDLSDAFLAEFSITFSKGVHCKLRSLALGLNNNDFNYKGIKKLASCLGKSTLNCLSLNLNSIQFKQEGATEMVFGLRKMYNLEKLTLNIRNVGLKKNQIAQLKNDLQKEKTGKEFITLEFLA